MKMRPVKGILRACVDSLLFCFFTLDFDVGGVLLGGGGGLFRSVSVTRIHKLVFP